MKLLEKDRTRRYETVNALVTDIQRHLKHEPILAGSPGTVYRLQKFLRRHRSRIVATAAATALLVALIFGTTAYVQNRRVRWARHVALPKITKLIEQDDYLAAFSLATKAEKYIPDDPALVGLWPRMCRDFSIITTPASGDIFFREYSDIEGEWLYLGRSPMENIKFPQGVYRWKIEKEGFDTHECVTENSFDVRLREEDEPGEMVWIDAWTAEIRATSHAQITTVEILPYLIDRYEVTNEQFKRFVDQGGYENREYWRESQFLKEGRNISWEQAISEFVDKTGQPGPATWEEGSYPEGQGRYPVSGVSWFEAVAYARFAGKSLPTVHHWQQAACVAESLVIVPFSNFDIAGHAPVGSHPGMGRTGLYDMAGNVKEWCLNATDDSGNSR